MSRKQIQSISDESLLHQDQLNNYSMQFTQPSAKLKPDMGVNFFSAIFATNF